MKKEIIHFSLKKSAEIIITLFLVTILSFVLMRLTPIDAATAYVQRNTQLVTQEQIEDVREELGLNNPLPIQYGTWIMKVLKGDLGKSLYDAKPVTEKLGQSFPITLKVVMINTVIMIVGITVFGILVYMMRNRFIGKLLLILSILGLSIPPFCMGIAYLDIFAIKLGFMSVQGNSGIWRYIPAAMCLSILGIAQYSQILAKGIEYQMNEDWAVYARCRGVNENRILWCHAFPNAAVEILPSFMQTVGIFFAGSAVVETVFSLPGLGNEIVHSVIHRDSPMIHAIMLILALTFVTCNLVADILRMVLDKRKVGGE